MLIVYINIIFKGDDYVIFRNKIIKEKVLSWFDRHSCVEFGENTYLRMGVSIIDKEGYKYILNSTNVQKDTMPLLFDKTNPYIIDNIKKFIQNNELSVCYIDGEYENAKSSMTWRCECGNYFQGTLSQLKKELHNFKCQGCKEKELLIQHNNYIINNLNKHGYKLFNHNICDKIISSSFIDIEDNEGYKYQVPYRSFTSHYRIPSKFHISNSYTIDNINNLLINTNRSDLKCVSKEYKGNHNNIKIKHSACGKIYDTDLVNIQNGQLCPFCFKSKIESNHASVLKQIFKHEYPKTILEDKSCVNPTTGRCMPTDIVNHELRIAIEIQSQFHDNEKQKFKDKIKKDFWVNNGYLFYSPDIRDYTIIGLVQLFFPQIKEIPSYIEWNFLNTLDIVFIQDEIDQGKSITQISEETGISHSTILGAVRNKKIILPKEYYINILNRKGFYMLDDDNTILKEFNTFKEADDEGYKTGTIFRVLNGKQDRAYGKKWIYKTEYKQLA